MTKQYPEVSSDESDGVVTAMFYLINRLSITVGLVVSIYVFVTLQHVPTLLALMWAFGLGCTIAVFHWILSIAISAIHAYKHDHANTEGIDV